MPDFMHTWLMWGWYKVIPVPRATLLTEHPRLRPFNLFVRTPYEVVLQLGVRQIQYITGHHHVPLLDRPSKSIKILSLFCPKEPGWFQMQFELRRQCPRLTWLQTWESFPLTWGNSGQVDSVESGIHRFSTNYGFTSMERTRRRRKFPTSMNL